MGAPLHDDPPVISACPSNIYEKYERVCRQLQEAEVKIRILEGQIDSFKQAFRAEPPPSPPANPTKGNRR